MEAAIYFIRKSYAFMEKTSADVSAASPTSYAKHCSASLMRRSVHNTFYTVGNHVARTIIPRSRAAFSSVATTSFPSSGCDPEQMTLIAATTARQVHIADTCKTRFPTSTRDLRDALSEEHNSSITSGVRQ